MLLTLVECSAFRLALAAATVTFVNTFSMSIMVPRPSGLSELEVCQGHHLQRGRPDALHGSVSLGEQGRHGWERRFCRLQPQEEKGRVSQATRESA